MRMSSKGHPSARPASSLDRSVSGQPFRRPDGTARDISPMAPAELPLHIRARGGVTFAARWPAAPKNALDDDAAPETQRTWRSSGPAKRSNQPNPVEGGLGADFGNGQGATFALDDVELDPTDRAATCG
jgi:hypothetical protein